MSDNQQAAREWLPIYEAPHLDVARLRELLAKATPGPWQWDDDGRRLGNGRYSVIDFSNTCQGVDGRIDGFGAATGCNSSDEQALYNLKLISQAVNTLPLLLQLVDEERKLRIALEIAWSSQNDRAEAAERALEESKRANPWLPIESAPKGVAVLIHYKNRLGKSRVIKARYIERFTEEAGHDCEEGVDEYDEANDRYTYTQGWWEMIDNWDEYGFVMVHEGQPDMWHPIPTPPDSGEK